MDMWTMPAWAGTGWLRCASARGQALQKRMDGVRRPRAFTALAHRLPSLRSHTHRLPSSVFFLFSFFFFLFYLKAADCALCGLRRSSRLSLLSLSGCQSTK